MGKTTRLERSVGIRMLHKTRDSDGAILTLDRWTETDVDTRETQHHFLICVNGNKKTSVVTYGEYDPNAWSAVNLFSRMLSA